MTSNLSDFAARLRGHIVASNEGGPSLRDDAAFNQAALELFSLQFDHNLPYRALCETRGVFPPSVQDWTQIPAVPASAFKELELSCLPSEERTAVFHSSGTTGRRPGRHFHSAESLGLYESSLWQWFAAHVVGEFKVQGSRFKVLALTPAPARCPHSSLVHMFDIARRELGASESAFVGTPTGDGSWSLDFDKALGGLRRAFQEQRPVLLLGTAFTFVHLLDFMVERDIRLELPHGSRVMETGGYKGRSRTVPRAELHSLMTRQLGIPATRIVCEYGMSELSSQAYDTVAAGILPGGTTPHPAQVARTLRASSKESQPPPGARMPGTTASSRPFHFPSWCRVQVISPEAGRLVADGETGLLRIYDLANVFSVMALQAEDLAVRRGDGFELIGRAPQAEPRGCSLMSVETLEPLNRWAAVETTR